LNCIKVDFFNLFKDINVINSNLSVDFNKGYYWVRIKRFLTLTNDFKKYALKKYVYTINHKRIAINYFFFSMWTGLSGAGLATMIRLELAYPGSTFFKGDSLRYLQVISAHGLIMVFFCSCSYLLWRFCKFFNSISYRF